MSIKDLEKKAADVIARSINTLAKINDRIVFAIPGGRSVAGIFEILKSKDIPWKKVHIFMVDERLVTIDHQDSNFLLAKRSFIDELTKSGKIPNENVHPFLLKNRMDFGLSDYNDELKELGGKFHIVLLSSGEDGHIGALYPNHDSIMAIDSNYIFLTDSPKPPPERMTASKNLMLRSDVAIILFFGDKKEALTKFYDTDFTIKECPNKLVQKIPENYVFTDVED